MPRYKSRRKSKKDREKKRVLTQMTRDKRHLTHWAVRGSHEDYSKLRRHTGDVKERAPSYVQKKALDSLETIDRSGMVSSLRNEVHTDHWFSDGLSWLIDQIPSDWEWNWAKSLGQAALKPFRGDSLSETDQQYARLVNEAYKTDSERDPTFEHWHHVPEFDSNYITVYDNADGHRFIAVRGTKINWQDAREDVKIATKGQPDDLISKELRRIIDNTEPDKIIDLGAHSLGTSLSLLAYQNDKTIQDRIHESYLFNPAFTPFSENITDKYEKDDRVRYFIDLSDVVSVGDLGSKGPVNAVYRNNWNPITAHKLVQWGGETGLEEHDDPKEDLKETDATTKEEAGWNVHFTSEGFEDRDRDGIPDKQEDMEPVGDDIFLDFGDNFDSGAWNVYFNP